eukprot:13465959-Alexandrium_andersonii.AAC.1
MVDCCKGCYEPNRLGNKGFASVRVGLMDCHLQVVQRALRGLPFSPWRRTDPRGARVSTSNHYPQRVCSSQKHAIDDTSLKV